MSERRVTELADGVVRERVVEVTVGNVCERISKYRKHE
jgi:hypothetical protein